MGIPIHYWTYSPSTTKQPPYLINSNQYPKYNKKENNLVVVWLVLIDLSYAPGWINFFFVFSFWRTIFLHSKKNVHVPFWLVDFRFTFFFFIIIIFVFFRIEIGCVCVCGIYQEVGHQCVWGFFIFQTQNVCMDPMHFWFWKRRNFLRGGQRMAIADERMNGPRLRTFVNITNNNINKQKKNKVASNCPCVCVDIVCLLWLFAICVRRQLNWPLSQYFSFPPNVYLVCQSYTLKMLTTTTTEPKKKKKEKILFQFFSTIFIIAILHSFFHSKNYILFAKKQQQNIMNWIEEIHYNHLIQSTISTEMITFPNNVIHSIGLNSFT